MGCPGLRATTADGDNLIFHAGKETGGLDAPTTVGYGGWEAIERLA